MNRDFSFILLAMLCLIFLYLTAGPLLGMHHGIGVFPFFHFHHCHMSLGY